MKFKRISITIMAAVMLLSGCSKQEMPGEISSEITSNSEISDPMQNSTDDPQGEKIPSISYGIYFTDENVSISNGKLVVSPKLMGGGADTHVGIMVFVDGVPQKYAAENSAEESYMSTFDIEANSEKTHNLKVDAKIDGDLDKHFISVITMLAPEYVSSPDNPYFGFYHRILRPVSLSVSEEVKNALPRNNYQILKTENSVMTKKQLEKFGLDEDADQGYGMGFYLLQSENLLETSYTLPENEKKLKLNFCAFTTVPTVETFRVTFFVNHKQVNFNGNQEYLDVTMEGEKITEREIEIDNVNAGDFVYCIAVPLVEGESTYKSDSKMILSTNAETPENNSSSSDLNSQEPDTSTSSQEDPQEDQVSTNPAAVKEISFNNKIVPLFSIGESMYAVEGRRDVSLLKINHNGEILKKSTHKSDIRVHGSKISSFENNIFNSSGSGTGSIAIGGSKDPSVSLALLDAELNELKKLKITDHIGTNYDFDDKRIVYVYRNDDKTEELRVCDWDLKNHKTLMILPAENDSRFNEIALADGFIAFRSTDKTGNYYGVCDFNGKVEKHLKSNMSSEIQVIGDTALWFDKHVNAADGEIPSGEVVLYRNGKFEVIRTENPIESQDVFLTEENEFVTLFPDNDVLRIYKNGVKTAEISLESEEYIFSVIRAGSKIVAGTAVGNEHKLKIWEMK